MLIFPSLIFIYYSYPLIDRLTHLQTNHAIGTLRPADIDYVSGCLNPALCIPLVIHPQ